MASGTGSVKAVVCLSTAEARLASLGAYTSHARGGKGGSRLQAITVGPAGGELESMIVHSRHNTNNTMELEAATKGGNKRVEF